MRGKGQPESLTTRLPGSQWMEGNIESVKEDKETIENGGHIDINITSYPGGVTSKITGSG